MVSIEDFGSLSLKELCGAELTCGCGETHTVLTRDIACRAGAVDELPEMIEKHIGPLIKVYIVAGKSGFDAGGRAAEKLLLSRGFKTARYIFDEGGVESIENADKLLSRFPEDAKAVVAVGGGKVLDMAKYAAYRLKVPWFSVVTSLSSDSCLAPFSMLYSGGFKEIYVTAPPVGLIADTNILSGAGEALVAAGYGLAVSKRLAVLDWEFSSKLTGEKYCPFIAGYAVTAAENAESLGESLMRGDKKAVESLAENVLRLSLLSQIMKNSRLSNGGGTHLCFALSGVMESAGRKPRLYGETAYLSAIFLSKVYRAFLRAELTEFLPPPDLNLRAEKLAAVFHTTEAAALKKVRPYMPMEAYAVASHKYREYRADFFASADNAVTALEHSVKAFRRMYGDAGYWIKNYISEQDYRTALALAPDLREKYTVLTYMRDLGLLDRYLV